MRNFVTNSMILLVSILITIVTAEFLVRLYVDPVNYLEPYMESDPILGHKVVSSSGGHDLWGYRNNNIPTSTNILAIGDSQTYGVMAPADKSWPSQLAQLTNQDTYNLSLGGYGPLQYLHLLKSKAKILDPELIVVGIYTGNDFIDTYRLAYNNSNWSKYRSNHIAHKQSDETIAVSIEGKQSSFRDMLAHHSVIYRMITSSFIGDMVRLSEARETVPQNKEEVFFVNISSANINTGFTPKRRLTGLDLSDVAVKEGFEISLLALKEIRDYSLENNYKLLVVIIPTKEYVYAELLHDTPAFRDNNLVKTLLSNESLATDLLVNFLSENDIRVVQPLELMRLAVFKEPIYPGGYDGHPNGKGYEVIARAIQQAIQFN